MPQETTPRSWAKWALIWTFLLLVVVIAAVITTLWLTRPQVNAAPQSGVCTDGYVMFPDGIGCQEYDSTATYWDYTDYGERFLKEDDVEPMLRYFLMEEYLIDFDRRVTAGFGGVIGVQFENPCWPIDQSMVEQGYVLMLPGPEDPMLSTDVAPDARTFIADLFSLSEIEVESVELDATFRVFFTETVSKDKIEPYVDRVYKAMLDSGWCQYASGSSA